MVFEKTVKNIKISDQQLIMVKVIDAQKESSMYMYHFYWTE